MKFTCWRPRHIWDELCTSHERHSASRMGWRVSHSKCEYISIKRWVNVNTWTWTSSRCEDFHSTTLIAALLICIHRVENVFNVKSLSKFLSFWYNVRIIDSTEKFQDVIDVASTWKLYLWAMSRVWIFREISYSENRKMLGCWGMEIYARIIDV